MKNIESRQRHKACGGCRRSKEKCDGLHPCSRCKRRKIGDRCIYPPSAGPAQHTVVLEASSTNPPVNRDGQEHGLESTSTSPDCAPVPQQSRVIRNARGRYVYIGNSASLSFLHYVRRIVASAIGPCPFTEDVYLSSDSHRHQMIETAPLFDICTGQSSPPDVEVEQALALTDQFALATEGVLDLFEHHVLLAEIRQFAQSSDRMFWPSRSVLYLVLALGAQARADGPLDDYLAESYFHFGLRQAMSELVDEPGIFTVQTFCMVTWYALAACRRSVATMYLGIAVQAAYTIGLHRPEANVVFPPEQKNSREKAWTALRFCDIYVATSLGRPLMTCSSGGPKQSLQLGEERPRTLHESGSQLMRDLCNIFERILSEVYMNRSVTIKLVESIAKQHQLCGSRLSDMLERDDHATGNSEQQEPVDLLQTHLLRTINLTNAYHYSIILLTRPILAFQATLLPKHGKPRDEPVDLSIFADACVCSVIKVIDAANELVQQSPPKRLPLIINTIFVSALCLGVAYLWSHDDREHRSLDNELEKAVVVLTYFAPCNPQAARYVQIIRHLAEALRVHKQERERSAIESRRRRFVDLFGEVPAISKHQDNDVSGSESGHPVETFSNNVPLPVGASPEKGREPQVTNLTDNADFTLPLFDWSLDDPDMPSSGMFLATCEDSNECGPAGASVGDDTCDNDHIFQDDQSLVGFDVPNAENDTLVFPTFAEYRWKDLRL